MVDENNDYKDFIKGVKRTDEKNMKGVSNPIVIAKCIYKAANDKSNRLRYHAGKNATLLLFLRKILPDYLMFKIIKASST